SPAELRRARDWISRRTEGGLDGVLIVVEGTGSYGAVLSDVWQRAGYRVVEAPTPRPDDVRSRPWRRGRRKRALMRPRERAPRAALVWPSAHRGNGEGWEQGSDDEVGGVLELDSAGGHLSGGSVHGQMGDGEQPADRKLCAEHPFTLSAFEETLHAPLG